MFSVNDRLIGPSRGSAQQAKAYAQTINSSRLVEVEAYIEEVYRLCEDNAMPDAALVVAQSSHETDIWRSSWWVDRLNPGGLGITGTASQDNKSKFFISGIDAARSHVAHILLYATGGIDRGGLTPDDDPRYEAYRQAYGEVARATTVQQLSGTWAADTTYAPKIIKHANALFPNSSSTEEHTGVNTHMKPYRFVGLDKDVWLPDDILVEINIVPASRTNVRSRQPFTGQTFDTWHDTGNNGSTSSSEENWLHFSMPWSQSAGYNFAADGVARTIGGKVYRGRIVQLTPLNEVTWAAGTPEGNRLSWHSEQCFGVSNVWTNSLYVTASLHGGLCAAKGWDVREHLVPHQKWYGKWCPGQILNRGIWNEVVDMVVVAARNATLAAGGTTVPIESVYGKPSPVFVDGKRWEGEEDVVVNDVTFFEDPRTVTTGEVAANIRVYATTQSQQTGAPVAPNTPVDVVGWCKGESVADEDRWWVTKFSHSRMWVGGTVEKPEDANVEEPLPDTDGSFRVVNGQVYYPVSNDIREVTTINEAVLRKYADLDSEVIKTLPEGSTIKVAYWCLGDKQEDEAVWWILDDEQGRDDIAYGARVHASDTMERPD